MPTQKMMYEVSDGTVFETVDEAKEYEARLAAIELVESAFPDVMNFTRRQFYEFVATNIERFRSL